MNATRRGFLGLLAGLFASRKIPASPPLNVGRSAFETAKGLSAVSPEGISIRLVRSYDAATGRTMNRIDALYGMPAQFFPTGEYQASFDRFHETQQRSFIHLDHPIDQPIEVADFTGDIVSTTFETWMQQ